MRALLGRFVAGTAARKRALLLLACLPLAAAFIAGVLLGVGAEAGGWGTVAILASIPLSMAAAFAVGRLLFGAAQSIRRVQGAFWLVDKLEPLNLAVDESAPVRVNIVHPAIDLKHFFGGFIAVFNLAKRLAERGHSVRLDRHRGPRAARDWRQQLAGYEGIGSWIDGLEVAFAADRSRPLEVSPEDTMIATHWTVAHVAAAARPELRGRRFLYLIQEYEPFIFPMGSAGALCRRSYELPHPAMFSTDLLRDWFAKHGSGSTRRGPSAGDAASVSFSNAITPVGPVEDAALRRAGPRRLLFYARPEEHAARNLYEIGAMALDRVLADGRFEGWDLTGVGTVERRKRADLPRSGRTLRLMPRSSQSDYAALLRSARRGIEPHVHAPPEPATDRDGRRRDADRNQHLREQGRRSAREDLPQPDRRRAHGRCRLGGAGPGRNGERALRWSSSRLHTSPGRVCGTRRSTTTSWLRWSDFSGRAASRHALESPS